MNLSIVLVAFIVVGASAQLSLSTSGSTSVPTSASAGQSVSYPSGAVANDLLLQLLGIINNSPTTATNGATSNWNPNYLISSGGGALPSSTMTTGTVSIPTGIATTGTGTTTGTSGLTATGMTPTGTTAQWPLNILGSMSNLLMMPSIGVPNVMGTMGSLGLDSLGGLIASQMGNTGMTGSINPNGGIQAQIPVPMIPLAPALPLFNEAIRLGGSLVQNKISSTANKANQALAIVGSGVNTGANVLRQGLDMGVNIGKAFTGGLANIATTIANGGRDIANHKIGMIENSFPFGRPLAPLTAIASGIVNGIADKAGSVATGIKQTTNSIMDKGNSVAQLGAGIASGVVNEMTSGMQKGIASTANYVNGAIADGVSSMQNLASGITTSTSTTGTTGSGTTGTTGTGTTSTTGSGTTGTTGTGTTSTTGSGTTGTTGTGTSSTTGSGTTGTTGTGTTSTTGSGTTGTTGTGTTGTTGTGTTGTTGTGTTGVSGSTGIILG